MTYAAILAADRAFDTPPVDVGPGYSQLGEAMREEKIERVRYWQGYDCFTVALFDGRIGRGKTIREAVRNAAPVLS